MSHRAGGNDKSRTIGYVSATAAVTFMVPVTGIELVTYALRVRCSTN